MMTPTLSQTQIFVLFAVSCLSLAIIPTAVAAPYQELAPRAGYIPVYIRYGDTPLSEIHPGLAEAFNELQSESLKVEHESKKETEISAEHIELPAEAPELTGTDAAETKTEPESTPAVKPPSDIASFDVIKALDAATEGA